MACERILFRERWLLLVVVVALAVPAWAGGPTWNKMVEKVVNAYSLVKVVPNPTKTVPMDVKQAYAFQKDVVEGLKGRWGPAIGYKAGLTNPKAQQKFGLSSPVYGVLFRAGLRRPGAVIHREDFVRPFVEIEIGFVIKRTIKTPPARPKDLINYIGGVFPAVELPDLAFADMKNITVADIIAGNVGARMMIKGLVKPPAILRGCKGPILLTRGGAVYNQGRPSDAMGGPLKALFWLVSEVVRNGGQLKAGDIVITGALGRMKPLKPGKYRVNYGKLGTISFSVL